MAIHLSEALEREIRAHAAADYPHECCGLMLGSAEGDARHVTSLRPVPNVHQEGHERRYLIAPEELLRIERESRSTGEGVIGVYHSHPDHPARPSEYDREWAWPWYSYIIVAVESGRPGTMTCWTLKEDETGFDEEIIVR